MLYLQSQFCFFVDEHQLTHILMSSAADPDQAIFFCEACLGTETLEKRKERERDGGSRESVTEAILHSSF
jgi:uncharacterized glyoxalase superfamily protein PhnB